MQRKPETSHTNHWSEPGRLSTTCPSVQNSSWYCMNVQEWLYSESALVSSKVCTYCIKSAVNHACVTCGGTHWSRWSALCRVPWLCASHSPAQVQSGPVLRLIAAACWRTDIDGSERRVVGGTGVLLWQEAAVQGGSSSTLLSVPLLSGQTGWINHLQRCQHLPKQFQIGINGRWGCCSLCLISSTKCGFISYKMKPSVARRCKDQVREDGGRGWQRERCACLACAHFFFFYFACVVEKRETESLWNRQCSGSAVGGKEKHLSIKKKENVILQSAHTSTLISSFPLTEVPPRGHHHYIWTHLFPDIGGVIWSPSPSWGRRSW